MAYYNMRLPENIERGARGGPGFMEIINDLASGRETRNSVWEKVKHKWDVGYGVQTKAQYKPIIDFFMVTIGSHHTWRFKDWSDFELPRQVIGTSDGSTNTFQAYLRYDVGGFIFDRPLDKIVVNSETAWFNGSAITKGAGATQYTIDYDTGIVTIGSTHAATSGQDLELLAEFDIHMRFDENDLDLVLQTADVATIPPVMIKAVIDE